MSDKPMVSERDAVLRERAAYVQGVAFIPMDQGEERRMAERLYPLPMIERPRVVSLKYGPHFWRFRVNGGTLEWGGEGDGWKALGPIGAYYQTPEFMIAIGKLFENPTELVPDEGDV